MSKIWIDSEIAPLRKVLVHRPGPELLAVTPSNREEYLYGDVLDHQQATLEHARFSELLSLFSEVLCLEDLLQETFALPAAREFLIERSEEITTHLNLGAGLHTCTAQELVERYIRGWRLSQGPFSDSLGKTCYVLPPLPNLFFTRDAAIILGEGLVIASMCHVARWPEELLMRTVMAFHPALGNPNLIYDGSSERRYDYTIEGGDVHPITPELVVIGISPRTSVAAVDVLAQALFESTSFKHVVGVVLPPSTSAIHLDMVWTQIDHRQCVAYPPIFQGPTRSAVVHLEKGKSHVHESDSLFTLLKNLGSPIEPIWAGGAQREQQEREVWTSGCNFLTVRPGVAISYARNHETLNSLDKAGYRCVASEDLGTNLDEILNKGSTVITFQGSELVRGGGGPRCMTCPILRDPT